MEACWLLVVSIFTLLTWIFYKYLTKNNGYWKSRGIPEVPGAVIGFGHTLDQFLMRKSVSELTEEFYDAHPGKSMVGLYMNRTPVLMVRHPELIKFVLHSGFQYFADNPTLDEKADPLLCHDPFFKNGNEWKEVRAMFVSAFSLKKLKSLVPTVSETCEKLLSYLKTIVPINGSVDIEAKSLFSRYTAGVACRAYLGIDGRTFVEKIEPRSLLAMMKSIFDTSIINGIKQNLIFLLPELSTWLANGFAPKWVNDNFTKIIEDIQSVRKSDGVKRSDILQHICDYLKESNLNEKTLAAHMFGFFVETFETSSLTLSYLSYFSAKYPKVQDKMRDEVERVLEKHGSVSSYEALNDMTYMELVIKEGMRLYPTIGRMVRLCSKSVTLTGPDGLTCSLKPGDEIHVPVTPLHKDPNYWDNPNEFIPERFDKRHEKPQQGYVYVPFGEGPRLCPGQKMALMQVKAAMANILMNYVIEQSDKLRVPVKIDPKYFIITIYGGFWIRLRKRN